MKRKQISDETADTICAGIAAQHICDKYGMCNPTQIIETIAALRSAGYLRNTPKPKD